MPSIASRARSSSAKPVSISGARSRPYELTFWPSKRDLPNAFSRRSCDFGEDLAGPAAHLATADARNDAVGAHRVATHRHLHPCLDGALALRRELGREPTLVGDAECRPTDADATRSQPVAEVTDGAGAERDVDERVLLEDPVALGFRVTAADGDDRAGAAPLERCRIAEMRGQTLVGLLPDRARVEDEDVGLVAARRLSQAQFLQQPSDALGIVSVHLAAERGHEVAAHPGQSTVARPVDRTSRNRHEGVSHGSQVPRYDRKRVVGWGAPDEVSPGDTAYRANSTARDSRITVTLICPG